MLDHYSAWVGSIPPTHPFVRVTILFRLAANIPDPPHTLLDTQMHLFSQYIVHAFADEGYWGYWDGWESLSGCADAENYRLVGMFITSFASLTIVICKSRSIKHAQLIDSR